jgi:CRISPR-associated protein Cmr3
MQKMSMTDYLIQLRPLTPYFFGGENTFGEDNANYFVRSNYLPQQTTLLGFLRYELLLQNGLLGTDPGGAGSTWNTLIGEDSFKTDNADEVPDFGAIKKISPLFLTNGTAHYLPGPMNWVIHEKKDGNKERKIAPLVLEYDSHAQSLTDLYRKKIPVLTVNGDPYTAKWESKSLWISAEGKAMRQWDYEQNFETGRGFENGFFIAEQQTGIFRQKVKRKGEKDEGDYYKKVSYRLTDDFVFAFIVTLDLPAGKKIESRVVTMGGERSVFEMNVSPVTTPFDKIFPSAMYAGPAQRQKALVLISDALADESIVSCCDYSITDTVPFRNIRTKTMNKGDYTRISGGAISKARELYFFLKRGSIFYADAMVSIKAALNKPAFSAIGYNQFIEI